MTPAAAPSLRNVGYYCPRCVAMIPARQVVHPQVGANIHYHWFIGAGDVGTWHAIQRCAMRDPLSDEQRAMLNE